MVTGDKKLEKQKNGSFLFVLLLFIIALAAGAVFTLILNESDTTFVYEYLNKYFETINTQKINILDGFKNAFFSISGDVGLIFLLSYAPLGFIITLFLYFYKSFVVGFSIGSIILNYKVKGIFLSFLYVFPHRAIYMLILTFLVMWSCKKNKKMTELFIKGGELSRDRMFLNRFALAFIALLVLSIYEVGVLPFILRLISPFIN